MEAGSFGEKRSSEKETQKTKNIINVYIKSLSWMYVMYVNTNLINVSVSVLRCLTVILVSICTQYKKKVFTKAESPMSLLCTTK